IASASTDGPLRAQVVRNLVAPMSDLRREHDLPAGVVHQRDAGGCTARVELQAQRRVLCLRNHLFQKSGRRLARDDQRPFPSAPRRTVLAPFSAHGSPGVPFGSPNDDTISCGVPHHEYLPVHGIRTPCRPSPSLKLSLSATPTTAPLPWGLLPVGNPAFR